MKMISKLMITSTLLLTGALITFGVDSTQDQLENQLEATRLRENHVYPEMRKQLIQKLNKAEAEAKTQNTEFKKLFSMHIENYGQLKAFLEWLKKNPQQIDPKKIEEALALAQKDSRTKITPEISDNLYEILEKSIRQSDLRYRKITHGTSTGYNSLKILEF